MRNLMQKFSLVSAGVVVGVLISLNFSAIANKEPQPAAALTAQPLPIEELRAFTEVFGRIKSDYVEPVEDKKLIREAINGMLLRPRSAPLYLDENHSRSCAKPRRANRRPGLEVGHGRRLSAR